MIQGLDLFADLQRNCRESCAQAVAKEQVSMEAIAHIAPLHTFAASREPGNNKTLLFLAGIIPTWPCIYHWLPPRSLTQLPFTCNLSASQQHKSDNDNPAKEKRGSPESFAQIVYYPPNITMCRWNNLDQTPYYIYIYPYMIYDMWCVYTCCVRQVEDVIFGCVAQTGAQAWALELASHSMPRPLWRQGRQCGPHCGVVLPFSPGNGRSTWTWTVFLDVFGTEWQLWIKIPKKHRGFNGEIKDLYEKIQVWMGKILDG